MKGLQNPVHVTMPLDLYLSQEHFLVFENITKQENDKFTDFLRIMVDEYLERKYDNELSEQILENDLIDTYLSQIDQTLGVQKNM